MSRWLLINVVGGGRGGGNHARYAAMYIIDAACGKRTGRCMRHANTCWEKLAKYDCCAIL